MKKMLLVAGLLVGMGGSGIIKGVNPDLATEYEQPKQPTTKECTSKNNKNKKIIIASYPAPITPVVRQKGIHHNPSMISVYATLDPNNPNCGFYFQIDRSIESNFPGLRTMIDDKGRVNLNTTIDIDDLHTLCVGIVKKDLQKIGVLTGNLEKDLMTTELTSVCSKLGVLFVSNMPKVYASESAPEVSAIAHADKPTVSLFLGETWSADKTNGYIQIDKQVASTVMPSLINPDTTSIGINFGNHFSIDDRRTALQLLGAYINVYNKGNTPAVAAELFAICRQFPLVMRAKVMEQLALLMNTKQEDLVGFQNNIAMTGIKAIQAKIALPVQYLGYAAMVAALLCGASWLKAKAGF